MHCTVCSYQFPPLKDRRALWEKDTSITVKMSANSGGIFKNLKNISVLECLVHFGSRVEITLMLLEHV